MTRITKDILDDQVAELLKQLEATHFLHRKDLLKKFIEDQLDLQEKLYSVNAQDLALIHSVATDYGRMHNPDASFGGKLLRDDPRTLQIAAYTYGVLSWLRSKDMLPFRIEVKGD